MNDNISVLPSVTLSDVPRRCAECPNAQRRLLKQKKPLMERKRRARINACFDQLKELLLSSDTQQQQKCMGGTQKENISGSMLGKVDLLEKTVAYVKLLQQQNVHLQQQNFRFRQLLQRLLLFHSEPVAESAAAADANPSAHQTPTPSTSAPSSAIEHQQRQMH